MKPNMSADRDRDAIDPILLSEDELIPTSGFLAATMERVREEAATPKPIPFPWLRALPGIVVAAAVLCVAGFELVRAGFARAPLGSAANIQGSSAMHALWPVAASPQMQNVGWVALALGISMISWFIARRVAGRSGLL